MNHIIQNNRNVEPIFLHEEKTITNENALYFRVYCENLKKTRDDRLDDILPTLSQYSVIVDSIKGKDFITKQLLLACPLFDLHDEVGKGRMSMVLRMFSSVSQNSVYFFV